MRAAIIRAQGAHVHVHDVLQPRRRTWAVTAVKVCDGGPAALLLRSGTRALGH